MPLECRLSRCACAENARQKAAGERGARGAGQSWIVGRRCHTREALLVVRLRVLLAVLLYSR